MKLKPGTLDNKVAMFVVAFVLFILFAQWWIALPVATIAFILGALLTGSVPS